MANEHENDYFVTPNGDGTWSIKRGKAGRVTAKTISSREAAINAAKGYLGDTDGHIYVTKSNGQGYETVL